MTEITPATYLKLISYKRTILFAKYIQIAQRRRIEELLHVYEIEDIKQILDSNVYSGIWR